MNNPLKYLILFLCLPAFPVQAQRVLTFGEYLDRVRNANISYLAEKYNVEIAEALVTASKVFPDPELSAGYANNQNWNLQMGYGVDAGLSYTLELGGKRNARIRVAQSEMEMTGALLEDYFRNLRADATLAYLTALKQRELYEIRKSSHVQMLELARADSIRFRLGEIMEVDARQSKLEAAATLDEVLSTGGDLQEVLVQLLLFQGDATMALPDSIAGALTCLKRTFDPASLVAAAQNNRADLQAALKCRDVSQRNLELAKANRAIDLGISIGGNYSSAVRNEIAPAPAFKGITAGVSIPLRFSNTNKGALRAARLTAEQGEKQYEAIELQISSEVMQAYSRYMTACRRAEHFDTGLLHDADAIFQKKRYGYERGEASILEVLNARRTYNDVRVNYNEALFDCASALVELERACGIWDIELQ
ncbi:MAG: TolC family protein [Tannerella sp.]|jgi:cobalt-zinc-cadmium efflux system outer membrane protein|nr:TolC family protein [Tannerella sp.]